MRATDAFLPIRSGSTRRSRLPSQLFTTPRKAADEPGGIVAAQVPASASVDRFVAAPSPRQQPSPASQPPPPPGLPPRPSPVVAPLYATGGPPFNGIHRPSYGRCRPRLAVDNTPPQLATQLHKAGFPPLALPSAAAATTRRYLHPTPASSHPRTPGRRPAPVQATLPPGRCPLHHGGRTTPAGRGGM